jgi:hypothetical protein
MEIHTLDRKQSRCNLVDYHLLQRSTFLVPLPFQRVRLVGVGEWLPAYGLAEAPPIADSDPCRSAVGAFSAKGNARSAAVSPTKLTSDR